MGVSKRREVVRPNERRRRGGHGIDVEFAPEDPMAVLEEGAVDLLIRNDLVEVAPLSCAYPRVEGEGDSLGVMNAHLLALEEEIKRSQDLSRSERGQLSDERVARGKYRRSIGLGDSLREVKVRDVGKRVHARIGPGGADDRDLVTGETHHGSLKDLQRELEQKESACCTDFASTLRCHPEYASPAYSTTILYL